MKKTPFPFCPSPRAASPRRNARPVGGTLAGPALAGAFDDDDWFDEEAGEEVTASMVKDKRVQSAKKKSKKAAETDDFDLTSMFEDTEEEEAEEGGGGDEVDWRAKRAEKAEGRNVRSYSKLAEKLDEARAAIGTDFVKGQVCLGFLESGEESLRRYQRKSQGDYLIHEVLEFAGKAKGCAEAVDRENRRNTMLLSGDASSKDVEAYMRRLSSGIAKKDKRSLDLWARAAIVEIAKKDDIWDKAGRDISDTAMTKADRLDRRGGTQTSKRGKSRKRKVDGKWQDVVQASEEAERQAPKTRMQIVAGKRVRTVGQKAAEDYRGTPGRAKGGRLRRRAPGEEDIQRGGVISFFAVGPQSAGRNQKLADLAVTALGDESVRKVIIRGDAMSDVVILEAALESTARARDKLEVRLPGAISHVPRSMKRLLADAKRAGVHVKEMYTVAEGAKVNKSLKNKRDDDIMSDSAVVVVVGAPSKTDKSADRARKIGAKVVVHHDGPQD